MNTQDCSLCNELQINNTAHACEHCGHYTALSHALDTDYEGSESDFEIAEQEDSFSYHLAMLEDDIPQEYGGQEYGEGYY